jgi:hypothetical protein
MNNTKTPPEITEEITDFLSITMSVVQARIDRLNRLEKGADEAKLNIIFDLRQKGYLIVSKLKDVKKMREQVILVAKRSFNDREVNEAQTLMIECNRKADDVHELLKAWINNVHDHFKE